ncbi:MAG TPA: DNA polymerase III subunit beta [Acidimicrobiales bacterium]|nr:DNA polymerase III subunit beta [Acidimicrobiales bacterium]
MKFRCERDVLLEALGAAGRAVAGRGGTLPVLSGLRIEAEADHLQVTGSDLDLTIRSQVAVTVGEPGATVLPGRLAQEIVRSLSPGAIEVSVDSNEATISSGRSEFALRTMAVEEYPHLTEPSGDQVHVPAEQLAAGLRQVVMAASSDDSRPILTGVLLTAHDEGLRLVATDSYRLAVRDIPGATVLGEGQKVLIPSRALGELLRVLGGADDVAVRLGQRDVTFEIDPSEGLAVEMTTRLIEGEFPNYRQLIPSEYPNRLTVAREELLEATRRVKLMAREAAPIRLSQSEGGLELKAVTQDVGEAREVIDAEYTGEELTVAFNPEYLIQGAEAAEGERISLETVDSLKPAVIRSLDGPEFLYLLMPVRVS